MHMKLQCDLLLPPQQLAKVYLNRNEHQVQGILDLGLSSCISFPMTLLVLEDTSQSQPRWPHMKITIEPPRPCVSGHVITQAIWACLRAALLVRSIQMAIFAW